jgi:predicted nuclease of predicted toxin-antitoxin system
MHFLNDASLPRSAAVLLRRLGHGATDIRDAGMRDAPDGTIAAYAKSNHLALVTRDFDFADIRNYPPSLYQGIVCSSFTRTPRRNRWRGYWLASPGGRTG